MNNLNKTLIAATIGAVAMGAQVANAAWTTNSATVAVITEGLAAGKVGVASTADVIFTIVAGNALTINDTITITLTGGMTFAGGVTLTPSAGNVGTGTATASPPLSGGAAGDTTATWRALDDGNIAGSTLTLNSLTGATVFDVSGMTTGVGADIQITLATGTGLPIGAANQSVAAQVTPPPAAPTFPFMGTALTTAVATTGNVTDTANVATGYTMFTAAAPTPVTTTATLFTTTFNDAAGSIPTPGAATVAIAGLTYTLNGDFTGITGATALGTGSAGSDASGVPSTPAAAGAFTIDAPNNQASASNAAVIAPGGVHTIGSVFTIDGTTSQTARSFTLDANMAATAVYSANSPMTGMAHNTIARNGVFFTTNSTGPANNIKITDTSGASSLSGGEISVVAFDAAGLNVPMAAGCTALPPLVASNATVIVPGADLTCSFPGAVRLDFTVNTTFANMSNVKKTADGTNLTIFSVGQQGL